MAENFASTHCVVGGNAEHISLSPEARTELNKATGGVVDTMESSKLFDSFKPKTADAK